MGHVKARSHSQFEGKNPPDYGGGHPVFPLLSASEIDGIPVGGKAPALLEKIQSALEEEFLKETER